MNMSDTDYWGLTQTPLTQNTHRCTCVCRLRRVFSWSHADYAKFADCESLRSRLSACRVLTYRRHIRAIAMYASAKVCGVCVRQKT